MKETLGPAYSNELIKLPSRLRIKQRLGHVSTSRHFKEQVVPKVSRMGGESMSVDEFLGGLSTALFTYPDGNPDISPLGEEQAPKIIHQIVKNPQLEERIMQHWHEGRADGAYLDLPAIEQEAEALQALARLQEVD